MNIAGSTDLQEEVGNRQIILKHYITGMVKVTDFEMRVSKVILRLHPGTTNVWVRNLYLSPDPYMRSRMAVTEDPYIEPFLPGEVITGLGVSKVLASSHPDFFPNDYVVGLTGWEDYTQIKDTVTLRKIPPASGLPLSYYLGVLGMPGLTAYAGFYKIGFNPSKEGEQLFVSGATGAVGHLVGQLGKISGCYVVGAAGSNEKVQILKQKLGFDDAFNYKEEADLQAALRRHIPKKIDIYWENVGGKTLEAVLENINVFGRIVACGMISQYNLEKPEGVSNLFRIVGKSVKMQGFLCWNYNYLYDEFIEKMSNWLKEGRLVYLEDVTEGLDNAVQAFIDLFKGNNIGKKIVKICDP